MKLSRMTIFLAPLLIQPTAFAAKCDVDLDLKSFQENPAEFMNKAVPKRDANCGTNTFKYAFTEDQIKSGEYVEIKDAQRATMCHTDEKSGEKVCLGDIEPGADVVEGRAPIKILDRAENLISSRDVISNIYDMEAIDLKVGSLDIEPWSDWYWPIAVGQLSYRYADRNMQAAFSNSGKQSEEMWSFMIDWHRSNKPLMLDTDLLSPAEKYDILVGDSSFTMTNHMLARPRGFSKGGKVATWMGICHGWSPASYMLPRPVKTIEVEAADGSMLTFRPTDLKALGSQLWATGSQRTKFVGARCNIKDPETDANGRIKNQNCFDNNPGSWHKTVVNQLGKNKKSFVMDATYDVEVWNHPVTAYSYKYFNPQTMEEYDNLDDAIVSMRNFTNDKFRRYRGRKAKSVVGIKMEVQYLVETMPSESSVDSSNQDAHNMAYYVYDLELDRNNNIIGGEWYTNKHPDFLWTPYDNSHANSSVDRYIRGRVTVDSIKNIRGLSQLARRASNNGQPIGPIVEALMEAASESEDEEILVYER